MRTLTYCHVGGVTETMKLWEPSSAPSRPVPGVVDIHGGGWVLGDDDLEPGTVDWAVEQGVVDHGWVFASIDYPLAPAHRWPVQLQAATCAVRYLRAEAASLRVDGAHVGVIGASAGGHLAAMLGLAGSDPAFDTGEHAGQSSAVQAVVDEFGPADLTSPVWAQSPALVHLSAEEFGVGAGQRSPVLVAASPVTYVHPGAPPFLVVQGAEDRIVPPAQSVELVHDLRAAGDAATLLVVEHAGHGLVPSGGTPTPSVDQVGAAATRFLVRTLGG
jgi:acetyl esterase/lipase